MSTVTNFLQTTDATLSTVEPQTLPLEGKTIAFGICGSVSAAKATLAASGLRKAGAKVLPVMTDAAARFVGPETLHAITGVRPYYRLFEQPGSHGEAHVAIAAESDVMVVMPATASFLSQYAFGNLQSPVSLTAANFSRKDVLVAPAMSEEMWTDPATQASVARLEEFGTMLLGPISGRLASGKQGFGRLVEPNTVVEVLKAWLGRRDGDLSNYTIVVSAGGCRETIDPVRYLSNKSSGLQGHALAEAARDRGAKVVLVTAATDRIPLGLETVVKAPSHRQMKDAIFDYCKTADVYIGAAAITDFRPKAATDSKIKRSAGSSLVVACEPTEDIIGSLSNGGRLIKVAFAAETDDHVGNAQRKYQRKGVKLVVLNDVRATDAGFAVSTNRVQLIDHRGVIGQFPESSAPAAAKYDVAWKVLDQVKRLLQERE